MVLPALFAACTNDDFESIQDKSIESSVLKDRAKGELLLNASKVGVKDDAETRIVGEPNGTGIDWYWEDANDKIGAVVVDYKGQDGNINDIATADDKYTITNYPFAPDITSPSASAEFSTPTAVVEGAYMFYNRYNGSNTQRGQITTELDRIQKVNAGVEAGLKQVGTVENGGQNFFISPIMDMAIADGEAIQTPVSLVSAYSVLNFTLKADLESKYLKNFTVNKIVLSCSEQDGAKNVFKRKLIIDPKAIAQIQLDIKKSSNDYASYFKDNGAIKTKENGQLVSDEQISKALNLVTNKISEEVDETTKDLLSIGTQPETEWSKDLQFQLETPFVFNTNDDVMTLYVLIPSGTYHTDDFGIDNYLNKDPENHFGLFKMEVYTSEGVYRTYLNTSDPSDARTFERGKKYGMPTQTLAIGEGKTNIDLFDQATSFTIETTEDWNYTIDYIKAHYRDYGSTSDWTIPELNIKPAGEGIVVDADHYFPAFPVKYVGENNAQLYLEGQEEYKINPAEAIFATGENRPTLVVNDKEASVVFDMDIKDGIKNFKGEKGTDGTDVTEAIRLVSYANVTIKKGTEVQFEQLENNGKMTIEEDVNVEVNEAYNDLTRAILVSDATAINSGELIVEGRLNAEDMTNEFTNAKSGVITVKGFENGMNELARGIATFNELTNNGTINIEVSADKKGTYGGKLKAATLNNNWNVNGSAIGAIYNNGELVATTVNSNGTITVGSDPYALIVLENGYVTSNGNGSVVLEDATQYEMFDSYYGTKCNIQAEGTVETTLTSQNAYNEMIKNYGAYANNKDQQRAFTVLKKITVKDVALTLSNSYSAAAELAHINFYLADNATLNVTNVPGATIASLNAIGANTSLAANTATTVNIKYIEVAKNANLTIADKAGAIVDYKLSPAISVSGVLTNKGYLDSNKGTDLTTYIPVTIAKGGKLVNEGRMSKKSDKEYDVDVEGSDDKAIADLIKNFYVNGKFNGEGNYRIEISSGGYSWDGNKTDKEEIDADLFKTILANGTWRGVQASDGNTYYGLTYVIPSVSAYAVYFGTGTNSDEPSFVKNLVSAAKATATSPKRTLFDQVTDNLTANKAYDVEGTLFKVSNYGVLDLSYSSNENNMSISWAYGESENMTNTASKVGYFTNELEKN